jgi:hypothetical protein
MSTRLAKSQTGKSAFAAETLRALSSALLLLGLMGDRRVS